MGTIKTTNIETITGSGTLTLGQSGETITIPSGVTITNNGTQTGFGGTNTPAFEAFLSAATTVTHDTATKIQFDTEIYDTDNCYDNSTNYRFTPTTAGKYFVYTKVGSDTSAGNMKNTRIFIYKNGTNHTVNYVNFDGNNGEGASAYGGQVIDMNGTSDYLEIYVNFETGDATNPTAAGGSSKPNSIFGAYRILT